MKTKKINEQEACSLLNKDQFELSFDLIQVTLKIRSQYYVYTKLYEISEEAYNDDSMKTTTDQTITPMGEKQLTNQDVKYILKSIKKNFKNLIRKISALNDDQRVIYYIEKFVTEQHYNHKTVKYDCKNIEISGYANKKETLLNDKEIHSIINAITYFLKNMNSRESYYGMKMSMSLNNPSVVQLSKEVCHALF